MAINGTSALLLRDTGSSEVVIVGQMELTTSFTGAPIDVSTKSDGDWVKLANGELSTKGLSITGSLTYNSNAEYERMRENALDGDISDYILDYTGLEADKVRFKGIPNSLSDAAPTGDKVVTSITILSVGDF